MSDDICAGYEVVCPDGLIRHYPYHNRGDAEAHARKASDPKWFAKRGCRLAPNPAKLELSMPPCSGGHHEIIPIPIVHPAPRGTS